MSAQGARDLKHDSFVEFLEDDISEGQIDKIHFGRCPRQAYRSSNRGKINGRNISRIRVGRRRGLTSRLRALKQAEGLYPADDNIQER